MCQTGDVEGEGSGIPNRPVGRQTHNRVNLNHRRHKEPTQWNQGMVWRNNKNNPRSVQTYVHTRTLSTKDQMGSAGYGTGNGGGGGGGGVACARGSRAVPAMRGGGVGYVNARQCAASGGRLRTNPRTRSSKVCGVRRRGVWGQQTVWGNRAWCPVCVCAYNRPNVRVAPGNPAPNVAGR